MDVMRGKTAIITGGARGIGLAIGKRYHEQGANIALCDIDSDALSRACSEFPPGDQRVLGVRADVTLDDDIRCVVRETVDRYGAVNVLVNNAGRLCFGRLDKLDPCAWDTVMRLNAFAPWRFMVAVLPEMRKAGGGAIVNISSINGSKAFQGAGLYCTSKAALQMISQVMALEVAADNIRVNLILPGAVEDTEFVYPEVGKDNADSFFASLRSLHPLGRNAKPADVADAALFLASDQSRYMTGVLLNLDGGRHLATNRPPAA